MNIKVWITPAQAVVFASVVQTVLQIYENAALFSADRSRRVNVFRYLRHPGIQSPQEFQDLGVGLASADRDRLYRALHTALALRNLDQSQDTLDPDKVRLELSEADIHTWNTAQNSYLTAFKPLEPVSAPAEEFRGIIAHLRRTFAWEKYKQDRGGVVAGLTFIRSGAETFFAETRTKSQVGYTITRRQVPGSPAEYDLSVNGLANEVPVYYGPFGTIAQAQSEAERVEHYLREGAKAELT